MRLIHYSKEALPKQLRAMNVREHSRFAKPGGLWFSVEGQDDWYSWCQSENFNLENLKYQTQIIFKPNARILHLKSVYDIRKFTEDYVPHDVPLHYAVPDWERVSKTYRGIIIAPYQWDCRLADWSFWYYGWDCASGVVWDLDAIKELKPLVVSEADT